MNEIFGGKFHIAKISLISRTIGTNSGKRKQA